MLRSFRQIVRVVDHFPRKIRSPVSFPVAYYKSQYNLENLYPNSSRDFSKKLEKQVAGQQVPPNEFTGYIPLDEICISYMKASGPGGQNVNKVNSKVEIRFHVDRANWIPTTAKEQLKIQERGRINKDGMLIVTSDKTRKQILNQADCFDKLRTMIYKCCELPYTPSEEEVNVKEQRISKSKRGILLEKREHSLKKQHRQSPSVAGV